MPFVSFPMRVLHLCAQRGWAFCWALGFAKHTGLGHLRLIYGALSTNNQRPADDAGSGDIRTCIWVWQSCILAYYATHCVRFDLDMIVDFLVSDNNSIQHI
jgi:hypothetical protein